MFSKTEIIIGVVVVLIAAGFILHYYFFNIYEVTYKVEPAELYADNTSTLTIESVPVNAMGTRVPFKDAPSEFEIKEGADLIEVVEDNGEEGIFRIKAKQQTGRVVIVVKSIYSLLPSIFEIEILPNYV